MDVFGGSNQFGEGWGMKGKKCIFALVNFWTNE